LNLSWQIWEKLLVAHSGDSHVKARLFVSYRMQYENFSPLPGEDIDAMFQRFTAIVNNMKANVEDFPYTEHDQALKLLHVLDPNVWGAKFEATLCVICFFSRKPKQKKSEPISTFHPLHDVMVDLIYMLKHMSRATPCT
jgi:hypothetical protein